MGAGVISRVGRTAQRLDPLQRPVVGPVALAVVLVVDMIISSGPPRAVLGALDEMAHFATAALLLLPCLRRWSPTLVGWAILAAVLIDLDHLPMELGSDVLMPGTARPVTHSMAVVTAAYVAGRLVRPLGSAGTGIGAGVAVHLWRDLATGSSVPLWWPISSEPVQVPYGWYLATLVAVTAVSAVTAHPRRALRRR